ncbi:glycosyltransferase family 2 protein [Halorussus lipolyticus]|uniref:glycosyltransferase family 2 protein n=1 Tax=Halorussus lipolyticus TaxID=3034024 RepID=UPI0023E7DEB5|nr:glycosyltransferase family 2 protein [Halorussus sp. DT80]
MYRENTVAVVIPAYDEAGFVGEVIDTIPEFVDRIYPVDDCSTDGTWDEIRACARRVNERAESSGAFADGSGALLSPDDAEPSEADDSADSGEPESAAGDSSPGARVVPLRHDENRGVGAAIKTGYRRARADGIDAVAVMAGDGQMDPDQLSRLLDPVVSGRADYAKGDRLATDEYTAEMSNWRLFGNALLTLLTRTASGYWRMSDPQNGYTVVSGEALDRLDLDSMFDDYGFANAMLVHLNVADMRVADVPMPAQYGDEDSGIRYSTFVPQLSGLLAKGFAWRLAEEHLGRERRGFPALYLVGAVGTVAGVYATVRDGFSSVGEDDADSESDPLQGNTAHREGINYNAEETQNKGQATMNTARTERPRGRGPLTTLVGLTATTLAAVFDAAENEPLHVSVESDEGLGGEAPDGSDSDEEVGDR